MPFYMQYIFTSKTNKGKSPCVYSKKMRFTLLHVFLIFLNLGCQKGLSAVCFSCVLPVFLYIICYIESLKTDIQKSPCMSLKKMSVTTFINSFISAYDSTAQDLAARIYQK